MATETVNLTANADTWTGWDSPQSDDFQVYGLEGADTLSAGWSGTTYLYGGEGDDVLSGGIWVGNVLLDGGAGDDQLTVTSKPVLAVYGGDGEDTLNCTSMSGVHLDASNYGEISFDFYDVENISGTDDGDLLIMDDGDNLLLGNGGNDIIKALGGADTVDGGDGRDDLSGGDGADRITGGIGPDHLAGDGGDDYLKGEDGRDVLRGGDGADTLTGGLDTDFFRGGAGADLFVFADGKDMSVSHPDFIKDLSAEDTIDLSRIDADGGKGGDGVFQIVSALDGHRGELTMSYDAATNRTLVLLDFNGDAVADKAIELKGQHMDFTHFVL